MADWKTYFGDDLITKDGKVSTDVVLGSKKLIAIYFSAHWCPPCRGFTPVLAEFYEDLKSESPDDLEIIFVSSDRDQSSFDEYYGSMPWVALPLSAGTFKNELSKKFDVSGIPALIVLGADGSVKDVDGRATIMGAKGVVKNALNKWK